MSNLKKGFIVSAIVLALAVTGFGTSTVLANNIDVTPDATEIQVDHETPDYNVDAFITGVGDFLGELMHNFVRSAMDPYEGDILGSVKNKEIKNNVNLEVIFDN